MGVHKSAKRRWAVSRIGGLLYIWFGGGHWPELGEQAPLIPSIADPTGVAGRWIRPLAPPFVAHSSDNTNALCVGCVTRSRRSRFRSHTSAR